MQYRQIANNTKYSHIGWTGVGNSLWMLKRNEEALGAYRNAMQSNPNYVDAILNYALLSENIKQMDKAAWAYRKLLTLPLKPDQYSAARRAQNFLRRYESQSPGQ
jgi:tetratricopeptide (TPR) repeat protein